MPKLATIRAATYYPWNEPASGIHYCGRGDYFPFSSFVTEDGRMLRRILIGRSPTKCQIRIRDDEHASNVHALLERQSTGVMMIHDSGSTNGVLVNRALLTEPVIVTVGMQIRLGDSLFIGTDSSGRFPVWGFSVDEYCANAGELYGNYTLAGERIGRSGEMVRQKVYERSGAVQPEGEQSR